MAPDEDDENEFRAPPPQEDRLWRHPSEVGAAARPVPARPTRSRPIGTIVASVLIGALTTIAILGLGGSFGEEPAAPEPPPNSVVPPVTTPPTTSAAPDDVVVDLEAGEEAAAAEPTPTTTTTIRSFPPIDVREVREAITGVAEQGAIEELQLLSNLLGPAVASVISDEDGATVIGAGLLVGSGDRLLTSHALVSDLDPLVVTLSNGTVATGRVSSFDPWTDLAVVDFDEPIGSPLVTEYARDTKVGSAVVVVGPHRGPILDRSLHIGVVSTIDSKLPAPNGVEILGLMRAGGLTGPLGSPVFDDWGRLVGLLVGVADDNGPRFVLPLGRVAAVADSLIRHDNPGGGWLGITGRSETDPVDGVLIVGIEAGGPADQADLREGDIVFAVTDAPVTTMAELKRELRRQDLSRAVALSVRRDDAVLDIGVLLGQPVFNESNGDVSPDPDEGTVPNDVPPGPGPVEPVDPLATTGT